jgi:hypothetical protein
MAAERLFILIIRTRTQMTAHNQYILWKQEQCYRKWLNIYAFLNSVVLAKVKSPKSPKNNPID